MISVDLKCPFAKINGHFGSHLNLAGTSACWKQRTGECIMVRFAVGVVLLIGVGSIVTGQDVPLQPSPKIRLSLPPEAPSEAVQIDYFMTGPFGGYGTLVSLKAGQSTYDIVASVDGKAAIDVKLIAYLPGCQIEILDIPVRSQMVSQPLRCTPLAQIVLHGQITPAYVIRPPSKVEVTYLADWDHRFFGIADGPVTAFHITAGVPDWYGRFDVTVPDFHSQAGLGEGEFLFTLENAHSRNVLKVLKPGGDAPSSDSLKVQAVYPPLIRFSGARMP
jgi:hypothetical protein